MAGSAAAQRMTAASAAAVAVRRDRRPARRTWPGSVACHRPRRPRIAPAKFPAGSSTARVSRYRPSAAGRPVSVRPSHDVRGRPPVPPIVRIGAPGRAAGHGRGGQPPARGTGRRSGQAHRVVATVAWWRDQPATDRGAGQLGPDRVDRDRIGRHLGRQQRPDRRRRVRPPPGPPDELDGVPAVGQPMPADATRPRPRPGRPSRSRSPPACRRASRSTGRPAA